MAKQKILIIVESPNKIKKISESLPNDAEYSVLASYGHISDLAKTGPYNLGITVHNNFHPTYVLSPDKKPKLAAILEMTKWCDKVLIATDKDREGECIGYLIAEKLSTYHKPIKRITFDEITKKGIKEGIEAERDIDVNIVKAAQARRVLDRIVGYIGSPFIIKRFGKGTSAGRVQSVALKMITEREEEIQTFKPDEYWIIKASLQKNNETFTAQYYSKNKVQDEESAKKIHEELKFATYIVDKVSAKEKKRNPPIPLNTAKLQMFASSRYRISPTKTMEAAQKLYENGLISYIRTDSLRLSDDALVSIRNWLSENYINALPASPNFFKNSDAAQNAHEAIRPTDVFVLPEKDPITNEQKIYKLIWEITVACQMKPALYDTTSVVIKTNGKKELRASGRVLKDLGWLAITQQADIEDDDNKDDRLPMLKEGNEIYLSSKGINLEQKFTLPPPRYKEATLIKELEKNGIGRPATYAAITSKILERNFVHIANDVLVPSDLGKKIVETLDKYFSFMKYDFTANMEKQLDLIEDKKFTYEQLIYEFYTLFGKEIAKAKSSMAETEFVCSACGSGMVLKTSAYGHFLGCESYPNCKNIVSCVVVDNKIIQKIEEKVKAPDDVKCPKCNSNMYKKIGMYGEFYCCETFPVCTGKSKVPIPNSSCPKCGDKLFKTIFTKPPHQGVVICCMNYPNCKFVKKVEDNDLLEKRNHFLTNGIGGQRKVDPSLL